MSGYVCADVRQEMLHVFAGDPDHLGFHELRQGLRGLGGARKACMALFTRPKSAAVISAQRGSLMSAFGTDAGTGDCFDAGPDDDSVSPPLPSSATKSASGKPC